MGRERTTPGLRRLVRSRLRLRVLLAVLAVTLVALVAFDFAAVTALRSYLMNQTDATLHAAALNNASRLSAVPAAVLQEQADPGQGSKAPSPDGSPGLGDVSGTAKQFMVGQYAVDYWPDDGDRGLALAFNPSIMHTMSQMVFDYVIPEDMRALAHDGGAQTATSADGTGQVRTVAVPVPGGILVVSSRLDDVTSTVDRMRLIVLIGSAAAVLLIGLGAFWLLRRGLRPIETMATQADRITAGNLTDRVTEQDPRSEVGRLGAALNGMLARIETGHEHTRRFFADASHELRTPLAALRANAELYQQGALTEREQVDEMMDGIALEARRMSGLVNDMLRLARLDQHPDQQREPVALSELIASCVHRIRVGTPQRDWHTDITPDVVIVGDEELLRRAVDNLLANVLAHTPEDIPATVALCEHGDVVEIEVSDTGPGVPEDRLPRIFDRFYRAGTTTSRPGSGLGLAIVTQIATVHNGTVVAGPNSPHGLRVRLTLPVAGLTHSHDSPAAV